jgi:AraC-like DNA-binding protein
MRRAAGLLKDPRISVAAVAARLGYRSEAAFRRAFKRLQGQSPGALRREAKA